MMMTQLTVTVTTSEHHCVVESPMTTRDLLQEKSPAANGGTNVWNPEFKFWQKTLCSATVTSTAEDRDP